MKDFDKKFSRLLLKLLEGGARITPADAKRLMGRMSRAKTPEQKKALLAEVQTLSAGATKSTKSTKATKAKATKAKATKAKAKKVVETISRVESNARARVRAVEEELDILSTIPGTSLPKIAELRAIAQHLNIGIADLGRKKTEILVRLHGESGGKLRKFDRLVQRIEAEKKDPNIRALRNVSRRNDAPIPTDLDDPNRRGRRRNKAIREHLLESTGGREFEPKFKALADRLRVKKGDTINKMQFASLRDMWADHLTTKYNMNQGKAFAIATRNVCKAFIYAGCANQRNKTASVFEKASLFNSLSEAKSKAIKLASSCGCAQFVTRDHDLGFVVTSEPTFEHINESLEFVAV